MKAEQKQQIKQALKKAQWAEKKKTGRRAGKKQLGESIKVIVTLLGVKPEENFKPLGKEPERIASLLGRWRDEFMRFK